LFNVSNLKEWMMKYEVKEKVYKGFRINFESHKLEQPEEFKECFHDFDEEHLQLKFYSVAVNYAGYPEFDRQHVVALMEIKYLGKVVGYYKLFFNFDGVVEDDVYVLY